MTKPTVSEFEAFQKLQDGLSQASSAALELAFFRADQKREWETMSRLYEEGKQAAFYLASKVGGGEVGKANN